MPSLAYYGLSEYGSESYYGTYIPNFLGIDSLTIYSFDYGELTIFWDIQQTGYSSIRLVRSSVGAPVVLSEGVIIYEVADEDDPEVYVDTNVTPGVLYYYSLFIFDDATEEWLLTAIGQGIPLRDWGYKDRLWELTPETFRESDLSVAANNPYFTDGPLKRFLDIFAGEYDHIRSEYETLRNLTNIPLIPTNFLTAVAHQFGLDIEPVLGASLTRRFLDNAVYIYKRKGSQLGTEVLIRATTGWDNSVTWDDDGGGPSPHVAISIAPDRANLILNPSFEYSDASPTTDYYESWEAGSNTTFSKMEDDWGYGGSGEAVNAASPMLLDYSTWGKHVWLPGIAGNYLSTPDSAALDITGDLEIVFEGAAKDWTPAATQILVDHYSGVAFTGYQLSLRLTTGVLRLSWGDGTAVQTRDSTVAPTITDRGKLKVKVTLDVDNGAGGHDVKFWTWSGSAWVQLGATVTTAGTTSVAANSDTLRLGVDRAGNSPLNGAVLNVEVRNGINGTLVADCRPADHTTGDTWVSAATGETWTVNRSGTSGTTQVIDRNCWSSGGAEYLTIPDRTELNPGSGDFWAFAIFATRDTSSTAFSKRDATAPNVGWELGSDAGQFAVDEGATIITTDIADTSDGAWSVLIGERNDAGVTVTDDHGNTQTLADTIGSIDTGAAMKVFAFGEASVNMGGQAIAVGYGTGTITTAQKAELRAWDGTVATEPSFLRAAAIFYANADDTVCSTEYIDNNNVINLAASYFLSGIAGLGLEANADGSVELIFPGGSYDRAPVTELRSYSISLDIKSTVVRNATLSFEWYDEVGTLIDTSNSDPISTSTASSRISYYAMAPENAVSAAIKLEITGCLTTDKHFVDAVLLELYDGYEVGEYFDGNNVAAPEFLWEGTNHLSRTLFFERLVPKTARLNEILEDFLPPYFDVVVTYVATL